MQAPVRHPGLIANRPEPPVLDGESERSPIDYSTLIRKYIFLAAVFTILGGLAGAFSVVLTSPAFKARAVLQVQAMNGSVLKMPNVEEGRDQVDLSTEAQIIKSGSFLRNVIERVQLDGFTPAPVQSDIFSRLRKRLKPEGYDTFPITMAVDGLEGQLGPPALAMALRTLDAHPVGTTQLLEVTCESSNPQFAATFLNTLADQYMLHNYQARAETVQNTMRWISGQLEETKANMLASDRRLQEFLQSSGSSVGGQENTLEESKLKEIQQKLSVAQSDLVGKQARYEMLTKSAPEGLADLVDDPVVRQYQARIADLRREEAVLLNTLTAEHPKVKKIESQISELQTSLQKATNGSLKQIEAQYETAKHDLDLLSKSYAALAQQVAGQTGKQAQYEALKKENEAAHDAYNTMVAQANSARIIGALPVNNIQVVDSAVPARIPSKPKPIINIGAGLALGLGFCCGFAFLREKMDRRLNSPNDARHLCDLPQLGVIPSATDESRMAWLPTRRLPIVQREATRFLALPAQNDNGGNQARSLRSSLLAESFRVTLASLMRESGTLQRPQVILVTSAGPGEGKTTIVSHLGVALAETGRDVVIVDADFRRPRVHEVFNLENRRGVLDLIDESKPMIGYTKKELGLPTGIPNLFALTNGRQSESITKALYSVRLRELVQRLRLEFDSVLIDAPPLLQVADARVISQIVDGIVLVLRSGVTDRDNATEALEQLRATGTPILGTVLNDWKPPKSYTGTRYGYYGDLK